ncbi:hypothetical protein J5X84_33470 [Streptosporangiaceae bacterium NEAU-GS5]|nr:hypothetical protein [Streptosporangiaceae bacterium NEAU-GS5]
MRAYARAKEMSALRRIVAGTISGLMASSLFVAGHASATVRTAPTVHIDNIHPLDATIDFRRQLVTFEVTSDAPQVELTLATRPGQIASQTRNLRGHQDGQKWTFYTVFDKSTPSVTWDATATATSADGETKSESQVYYTSYASRITHFRIHPRVVHPDEKFYFSGHAEVLVNGRWKDARNVFIELHAASDSDYRTSARTDEHGNFSDDYVPGETSDRFYTEVQGRYFTVGGFYSQSPSSRKILVNVLPKEM